MKIYIIVTHALYANSPKENHGPAHEIYSYLRSRKNHVFFLRHDLVGKNEGDKSKNFEKLLFTSPNPFLLLIKTLKELQQTFLFAQHIIWKYRNEKNRQIIFIGVDPLNAVVGSFLKLIGRINKNIYFTVDYADKRFENAVLNKLFHLIDIFCIFSSDELWSVSSRIVAKREKQGVSQLKNKFLPNSPDFQMITRKKYDGNRKLVIISYLGERLELYPILRVVKRLIKKYPDLTLSIIGSGPKEGDFKDLVQKLGLSKNVFFLGQMTHKDALKIVAGSFLGLALYEANIQNIYGDSMKAREYVACGIPVIINTVPATADDIKKYQAGLVLKKLSVSRIISFIEKCIQNPAYYQQLRKNALFLGELFDKKRLLNTLL